MNRTAVHDTNRKERLTTRLKDKVAIVTGGGSGIGRGVCLAYAREGAHVVVADINLQGAKETVKEIEAAGHQGLAVQTDVSDPAQVNAMVAAARAAFGRIDVLFNGAGITAPASLLDTTVEQWDRILTVNLRGQFLCLQAAARVMVEQGRGKIINVTSILGVQARITRGAYGASKAGVISLTQTAAVELGPHGVYANAIAPGSIETPMVMSAPSTPEQTQRKIAAIPLRRRGGPDDLTGPAIFLASDESDYVTGMVMTVDGGFTASVD
jgi:NAD(P)-dependent dehydrogenase (short-subunit alcohol dehydrogenase family)